MVSKDSFTRVVRSSVDLRKVSHVAYDKSITGTPVPEDWYVLGRDIVFKPGKGLESIESTSQSIFT